MKTAPKISIFSRRSCQLLRFFDSTFAYRKHFTAAIRVFLRAIHAKTEQAFDKRAQCSVHASSMNCMISVIALKVLEIGILVANSEIPDSAFVHRQLARKTRERKSNLEVFCVYRTYAALHLHRVYHSISNYVTFRFSQCFCLQPSNSRVSVQAAFINKLQSNAM